MVQATQDRTIRRGSFPGDVVRCVRFYSRLPMPRLPGEADPHARPDFTRMPRALPIAALIVALPAAIVLWGALAIGLPALYAAALAIAVGAIVSGAFHEDGLADMADGFWGGHTPERRLEIMKDSRVGAFGGVALGLSLILRTIALGDLVPMLSAGGAAAVLLASSAISRTAGLVPLALLPPARPDGFSAAVGRPSMMTLVFAMALAVAIASLLGAAGDLPGIGLAIGIGLTGLVALGVTVLSRNLIEGQTGDVAGAVQQLSEIAMLTGLLIATHALSGEVS